MKFSLSSTPILLIGALVIMSACSKNESENILDVRKTSWNLWMKDYIATPEGAGIIADGSQGLYRKQLSAPSTDGKAVEQGKDLREVSVSDIMTKEVVTTTEDTPIMDLIHLLQERHLIRVPVVKEKKLIGMVARRDVVFAYVKSRAIYWP